MGYSFVLFDVSLVISRGYFHCFFIGHTQYMYSPWAKSYFPVGKSSSGTATIVRSELMLRSLCNLSNNQSTICPQFPTETAHAEDFQISTEVIYPVYLIFE